MQRTRREAIDEFLGHVGEPGDPQARDLAEAALNRAIESIAMERTWRDYISPAPIELTLTANQPSYALIDLFFTVAPGKIRNLTRGGREIEQLSQEAALRRYPAFGTTMAAPGPPAALVIAGICGVHTQPSSAGEALEVLSDNAADTNNKVKVSIEGDDQDGRHRRREVSLTGPAPVAIGTWRWIDSFGKSYAFGQTPATEYTSSAGSVTLRKVSDETELQHLFPEESAKEHRVVTFMPTPAAEDVISIPFVRRPKRLLHDSDVLPADWWPAIMERMEADWRSNTGEASSAAALSRPELVKLHARENTSAPRPTIRPFGGSW